MARTGWGTFQKTFTKGEKKMKASGDNTVYYGRLFAKEREAVNLEVFQLHFSQPRSFFCDIGSMELLFNHPIAQRRYSVQGKTALLLSNLESFCLIQFYRSRVICQDKQFKYIMCVREIPVQRWLVLLLPTINV